MSNNINIESLIDAYTDALTGNRANPCVTYDITTGEFGAQSELSPLDENKVVLFRNISESDFGDVNWDNASEDAIADDLRAFYGDNGTLGLLQQEIDRAVERHAELARMANEE